MELLIIIGIYSVILAIGAMLRALIYKWTIKEMLKMYLILLVIGSIAIFFVYSCE